MQKKKRKKGKGKEGKRQGSGDKREDLKRVWGRKEKGEEKRSEEEENTWIYLKTRLYQSQAHSESRCFRSKREKKRLKKIRC